MIVTEENFKCKLEMFSLLDDCGKEIAVMISDPETMHAVIQDKRYTYRPRGYLRKMLAIVYDQQILG